MKLRFARILPGLLALSIATLPLGAFAQSLPAGAETITGHVATINDADTIGVNDDRGYVDNVLLLRDTAIYPQGSRLEPGMAITIVGVNRGSFFAANQITVSGQATSQAPPRVDCASAPYQQQPVPYQPQQPPASYQQAPVSRDCAALPPPFANAGELTGVLGTALDSKDAYVGEAVQLLNVASSDGSIRRATLYGTVTDVQRPNQGRSAQLELHFDRLRLADNTTYRIEGVVTQMRVSTKNNALKEAGGALAGMIVGNALGKTLLGMSGGGILGAVGGYLVAKDNRTDVTVPADSAISVRLLQARRQAQ